MTEVELIEQTALRVGMKSLMNHGAASCVYSEGCNGVSQEHLIAFAREIALHCVAALAAPAVKARVEVTEEMVTAYLTANDAYWKRTDELPARNPAKWRQGTPSEATRVSLRAALDAASPADAFVMSTQPHPDGPITLGMLRREAASPSSGD